MSINYNDYPILLIEDNENDVILVKRAFKKLNIPNPLIIFNDGEEAIIFFDKYIKLESNISYSMPILILLDLKLPKRSGFEILEYIKNKNIIKRIPVIILTSSSDSSDINKAYDLGANSYLTKPFSFEELLNMFNLLSIYWLKFNYKPEVSY